MEPEGTPLVWLLYPLDMSPSFLEHVLTFWNEMIQVYFVLSLPQPSNPPFLPGVLLPFSREWYSEIKIWVCPWGSLFLACLGDRAHRYMYSRPSAPMGDWFQDTQPPPPPTTTIPKIPGCSSPLYKKNVVQSALHLSRSASMVTEGSVYVYRTHVHTHTTISISTFIYIYKKLCVHPDTSNSNPTPQDLF